MWSASGSINASASSEVIDLTFDLRAEAEYEQAIVWYAARSPQATERFVAAFDKAIQAIRDQPTLFPLCDRRHRFVSLGRFPYSLIYRFDGAVTEVIAVAHSK